MLVIGHEIYETQTFPTEHFCSVLLTLVYRKNFILKEAQVVINGGQSSGEQTS